MPVASTSPVGLVSAGQTVGACNPRQELFISRITPDPYTLRANEILGKVGTRLMVETIIENNLLRIRVRGTHKLWAFRNSIEIPLVAIRSVKADPARARHAQGSRNPGTSIPGVLTAGTFHEGVNRAFWDVHNPDKAIVIELNNPGGPTLMLNDDRYNELIVEVPDPAESVEQIRRTIAAG
jgi:hypothetical protein